MKKRKLITLFISILLVYVFVGCSSNSNEYVEEKVVTSSTYNDANGEISFRGNSLKTVWKDKWRNGHQFRATIKPGSNVVTTTKCDYCGHMYYVHYDK